MHLIPSDFFPAYAHPDEAKAAFSIFDKDRNESITRAEIKTTIMKVYKERRFLARSLRDVGAALVALDMIMLLFVLVIVFISALYDLSFTLRYCALMRKLFLLKFPCPSSSFPSGALSSSPMLHITLMICDLDSKMLTSFYSVLVNFPSL